ncbi:MAG: transcription-repair coupling factor [Acidobacteriota bacterium]
MLDALCRLLSQHPGVAAAVRAAADRQPVAIEGLAGSLRAAVLSQVQVACERPLAVVLPGDSDLEALLLDLRSFHPAAAGRRQVVAFPPLGVDPYGSLALHPDVVRERVHTLDRCAGGRVAAVLGPVRSWLELLQPRENFRGRSSRLQAGALMSPEELVAKLLEGGYRRHSLVESLDEFALRGGIVDVFPPTREQPVRIEFSGNRIDSLREFNPRDQRSMRAIEMVDLPPASEQGATAQATATLADYLDDPLWVEVEPETLEKEAAEWCGELDEHYHRALAEGRDAPLPEELFAHPHEPRRPERPPGIVIHELALPAGVDGAVTLLSQPAPSFKGRLAALATQLQRSLQEGERICFAMSKPGKAERLAEVLEEYGVQVTLSLPEEGAEVVRRRAYELEPGTCWVICADLSAGFRIPEMSLWLGSDAEIFGRARVRGRPRRFHGDAFRADFRNLSPGDYVVHVEHGIGKFVGVRSFSVSGDQGEFMEIAYRGEDRLYLPLDQLHLVQRYRGVEGVTPKPDKLGGATWSKVKGRVKRSLREMAGELLELYAARKASSGNACGADTPWQREMEDAFEYEETEDQITAIAEVKSDMESPRAMDRLLCGDVGYGKTEVAMRAAFKAVLDGKQVAVLAPTTVLSHQHARTFSERLAGFPLRVELLSRFRTPQQQQQVIAGIGSGNVDIAIGTHRVLSKDVRFHDLGLLVIDEEQRFGVSHKERLKHLKREVDVLSMTATPIPRTLQMSLVGVRDLSVIESPPKDRFAVATLVMPYDAEVIASALREELSRGGQAYFVHNRVRTIYSIAETLRQLVPEARFRVAHGQLPERELERVMLEFVDHQADVLVTTTIIENGLDIPLANTMIINRADRFGLAQLYQLRGRVGRSNRRATAYLLIPSAGILSPAAKRRLRAIQEFADLGAGFRLAAMDLEIRGAGSLLGERQHGHMAAVGFDMYARLLEEAAGELRGEPVPAEIRAQLNLRINPRLPSDYVEDPVQRLMIAKRLASARDESHLRGLQEELRDRFGPLPTAVEELFAYTELRLVAEALGVLSVERVDGGLEVRFAPQPRIDLERLLERVREEEGWQMKPPDRLIVAATALGVQRQGPVEAVRELFEALARPPGARA